MNICLIGNPNCGKSTLFNALTGGDQKIGNWGGVTFEAFSGKLKGDKNVNIVDLPGVYSFTANSEDELAVIKYLNETPPDVIINVVDGTNLERNLILTAMLSRFNVKTVIAINMCDELEKNGLKVNINEIKRVFGVDAVLISAKKGKNLDLLVKTATNTREKIKLTKTTTDYLKYVEENVNKIIARKTTKAEIFTQKVDKILMSKYFGLPIFFIVITFVYFLSLRLGGIFSSFIERAVSNASANFSGFLSSLGVKKWLIDLLSNAVLKGIGTILAFLPQILILYALMTVIEESGYASRITFLFDQILRLIGLGGKSLVPFVLSCGCNVNGITATKTMDSKNEKIMTIFLAPFMPCSAKIAVFAWLSSILFGGNPFIASSTYFVSLICIIFFGLILKKFKCFSGDNGGFLIEIPTLRLPSLKNVITVLYKKIKEFILKAGSVILGVSALLWGLTNFGFCGYVSGDITKSFIYYLGNVLKYIFYPLGFGNWQCSVAVISGVLAKEAVIETLALICTDYGSLFHSGFSVYAFMVFILLSPPCVATISSAKRELKSNKTLFYMLLFQFLSAYIVALFINVIGIMVKGGFGLLLTVLFGIITAIVTLKCLIYGTKNVKHCAGCKGKNQCKKIKKRCTTI